ncbi:cyclase family protein [Clostridium sp. DL1XJH146]
MNKIMEMANLIDSMEVIDLSQVLEENIPVWPTHSKFMHNVWHSIGLGDDSTNFQIIMNEHNGTHVDMPAHFIGDGELSKVNTKNIELDNFYGPCVKIDCSDFTKGQVLEKEYITNWEKQYGDINEGEIVLVDFGWAKHWKCKPNDSEFLDNWPGVGKSAAQYLAEKKIKLLGVDTLAADVYGSTENPTHNILLGNKICIVENLNNLVKMKERGYFIAQPLKIKDGSASPIRPIGICEK